MRAKTTTARCALGWACWKTYWWGGRRRTVTGLAMSARIIGYKHHEAALSVREAELFMRAATWRIRRNHTRRANQSSARILWPAAEAAMRFDKTYTRMVNLYGEEQKTRLAASRPNA